MGEVSRSYKRLIIGVAGGCFKISDILYAPFQTSAGFANRGKISHFLTPVKFRGGVGEMSE